MSYTYQEVQKNGEVFTPLRATGLAVELAHKLAKEKGSGNVCWEDLQLVSLSGDTLLVHDSGTPSLKDLETGAVICGQGLA